MRDFVLLYINGREHRITGKDVFAPITDYLRNVIGICGTKVVCSEGDCGACTVLLCRLVHGKLQYKPINACIQYVFQLDSCHIVTVEGLKVDGCLNALQESMVDCHGAQCGYCTPGFVVAMSYLCEKKALDAGAELSQQEIKDGLTGNLCRCTGYKAIVDAGQSVHLSGWQEISRLYPEEDMIEAFSKALKQPIEIVADDKTAFVPVDIESVCRLKHEHPDAVLIAGGTDVAVNLNKKRFELKSVISLSNVEGLSEITRQTIGDHEIVEIGARVSLKELEDYLSGLNCEFDYIMWVFGSPQIRNAGTIAGNIANASPIADTIPYLMVMDGELEVCGREGRRRIGFGELYLGYKKLSLKADEIITRTFLPLPKKDELVRLYKISRRQHLDISAFTAAIRIELEGDLIKSAGVVYGGVAETVRRLDAVEGVLVGKEFCLDTFKKAAEMARIQVDPISDVRGSRDYRRQLAENIMLKFYYETSETRELVCL